jgi:hypothetical protein
MKFLLLLSLALFFVMSVEGNLRGDHGHHDEESPTLKKCKPGGTFVTLQSVSPGVCGVKGLALTHSHCMFFFPIVPDKNCGKPAESSGNGVFFSASSSGIEFRVPVKGECTTDNIIFTDADPRCYTHANCANYKPKKSRLGYAMLPS